MISLRRFQQYPVTFWIAIIILNTLLFLPWIITQPEPVTLIPTPSFDKPGNWKEVLFFWFIRDSRDFFRVSVDFFAILTLLTFAAKSRWATFACRSGIGLYFTLLLYEIYASASFMVFGIKPVIYNNAALIIDAWYLLLDIWSFKWFLPGLGLTLLILFLIWAVIYIFTLVANGIHRFRTNRVAVAGILLWLFILYMSFQFGFTNDRLFTRWTTPGIITNVQDSIKIYRTLQTIDKEPIDPTYFSYDDIHLSEKPNLYLFMIESYGKILVQDPELHELYYQLMKEMEQTLEKKHWFMSTNYSVAPIRAGRSWLSIATVLSGIRLDNQAFYSRFIGRMQRYSHLVKFLRHQGYSTLALQPPNRKRPWLPLGNAYGYKTLIFFEDLNYSGHEFGWGIIPDQYSLNYTHEKFIKTTENPFFLFFETATPHAPWDMLPPYIKDWREFNRKGKKQEMEQREPKTFTKRFKSPYGFTLKNYFDHMVYDIKVIQDYIIKSAPENSIIIIVGDHQPALLSNVETHGLETPIHILSKDHSFVESFKDYGFVSGLSKDLEEKGSIRHEAIFSMLVRVLAKHYGDNANSLPPYHPNGIPLSMLVK